MKAVIARRDKNRPLAIYHRLRHDGGTNKEDQMSLNRAVVSVVSIFLGLSAALISMPQKASA
jgi:hypothetical protein